MNTEQKMDLAQWAIELALKSGAQEAAVNVRHSREVEISYRDQKIDQLKDATSSGLSIDVYAGERYSTHSTNDLRRESLETFVPEAVAMTKYLSQDKHRHLPDPSLYAGQPEAFDLGIYDQSQADRTTEERVAVALAIEEAARGVSDQVVSCTAWATDGRSEAVKVHSNGFSGSRRSTSFGSGAEVTIKDPEGGLPEDWEFRQVRFGKDLPDSAAIGRAATQRALAKQGQKKLDSGQYDMILEARAATRLLYALYGPLTARSLYQKRSFLDGKEGQQIASDKLTWTDDPLVPHGLGSRLYDSEGIAAKRRTVIEKGVLKSFFVDSYYGRKLDISPTSGSSSNALIEPGTKSLDELIAGVERGILVNNFIGGNSNGTTGDFSYGVMGMLIENGKVVHPVSEMNVAGNQIDFWMKLAAMGNDVYEFSSWRRPSMLFEQVEFSGV